MPGLLVSLAIEHDPFRFRAAEVDADADHGAVPRLSLLGRTEWPNAAEP
ncbi:hypothetical protein [Azospirillum sp. sgz302134]